MERMRMYGTGAGRAWLMAALLVLMPGTAAAQEDDGGYPLSLTEALERALEQSEEVRLASARLEAADARSAAAWSNALPQINTQLGYTKTLRSVFQNAGGGFVLPDSLRFEPDPSLPLEERVAYLEDRVPSAAFGALGSLFSDLPFGNENTWLAGLSVAQPIFAGGRIRSAIQLAEHAEDAARAAYDEAAGDIVLQVREAYYDAALASETVEIVEASVELARGHLEDVRLREDAGTASELELLRAEVEVENLLPQLVLARNGEELALLNLKRLVNLPADAALELTTPLVPAEGDAAVAGIVLPPLGEVREQLGRRAALRAAESRVAAAEEGVDIARSAYLPTVALSANLARQAFPSETLTFPTGDDWQDDWTVGIAVQWPLFQGFRRNADVDEAQAAVQEAELQLDQLREAFALEYQQAQGELERARAQLGAAQRTAQQAERVYDLTEMRFREGLATQLDVDAARLSLQQARLNEVQAYHDAWIAIARAERALGVATAPRP